MDKKCTATLNSASKRIVTSYNTDTPEEVEMNIQFTLKYPVTGASDQEKFDALIAAYKEFFNIK